MTFQFLLDEQPPLDMLSGWLSESYRAIASKRLVAEFDKAQTHMN